MNTIEQFNSHVMPTYGRYPVVMQSGSGRVAVDENGKEYIDFGSGIGTNSLGFCDEDWAEAVCAQVRSIQHTSNYYYTGIQAGFADRLCAMTGYAKVFFGNSGAEANECAIKLARKYSFDKYGKGRHNIITLTNGFHGRTMATISATGQDVFHNYFFPFLEGFVYVEANNIEDLRKKADDTVCAIMFELIQGEGGVVPLEPAFVEEIMKIAEEKDILTIADEVQTGVGRTGKFLAAENYGIRTDITTLAKGIAGGLPMGVCLAKDRCADVLEKGTHGSTFGGNPVCCTGGLAVLIKIGSEGFLDEVRKKGEYLRSRLRRIPAVKSVDGIGLMLGAAIEGKTAAEVVARGVEEGLLLLTAKDKLRFLPPLTITYQEIDRGLEILERILSE